MRVLFRADAGASIGAGHVMRCLALAEAVQELGGEAGFAVASLPPALEERLRSAGMAVHRIGADPGSAADLAATRAIAEETAASAIVLDGYGFDERWRAGLAESGLTALAFDDAGTGEPIHAGLIVNAAPDAGRLPYGIGNPSARLLLGPDYAPLRREVREAAAAPKPPLEERRSLLVTFGGSDPLGLTAPVVERLAPRLPPGIRLDVAVGGAVRDAGAVEAVVGRRKSLLPAGVTGVHGDFAAGDPVDLCGPDGLTVARGLVHYDASEIPDLMGRSTRWLARELGPEYEREIIHRDDLVVLDPPR